MTEALSHERSPVQILFTMGLTGTTALLLAGGLAMLIVNPSLPASPTFWFLSGMSLAVGLAGAVYTLIRQREIAQQYRRSRQDCSTKQSPYGLAQGAQEREEFNYSFKNLLRPWWAYFFVGASITALAAVNYLYLLHPELIAHTIDLLVVSLALLTLVVAACIVATARWIGSRTARAAYFAGISILVTEAVIVLSAILP